MQKMTSAECFTDVKKFLIFLHQIERLHTIASGPVLRCPSKELSSHPVKKQSVWNRTDKNSFRLS
jgi:hypothetical protein